MENNALPKRAEPSATSLRKLEMSRLPLAVALLFLGACSTTRWEAVHPQFRLPAQNEQIALVPLGDAFILTRANWFAQQLGIPADSVHEQLARLTDTLFLAGIRSQWPDIQITSDTLRKSFAHESQKLDEKIFLKVQFPHQGQVLQAMGGTPGYLLIVHEYTLGLDLKREQFYDYRLANLETAPSKTVNQLSLLVSYTLWDNQRQTPLYSGISEVQSPLASETLALAQFTSVTQQAAAQCIRQLREVR